MKAYVTAFSTFKHRALHSFMTGLFFALHVIGARVLYKRRN